MIRWQVQSVHDHPDLARGKAPPGLLSAAESAHLTRLAYPKRRRDWLLGRWTAKHLLAAYLGERDAAPPLEAITVANDPSGAPYAYLTGSGPHSRIPVSLTISHSGDIAFCALISQAGNLPCLGADAERIEPRSPAFVRDFFTADEQAALTAAPPNRRDALATAIWSAKESALKALHLGLSVDTRQVSVVYGHDSSASYTLSSSRWAPVSLSLRGEAAHTAADLASPTYSLSVWQRALDVETVGTYYVLTLCVLAQVEVSDMAAAA